MEATTTTTHEETTTTTTVVPKKVIVPTTTTTINPTTTTTTIPSTERQLYLYEFVDQFSMTAGEKSFYEKSYNKPAGVKRTFSEWSKITNLSK